MEKINTYSTGATSHVVNELILFTNNDAELVKIRDFIYDRYRNPISADWQKNMKFTLLNDLFYKASNKYLDTYSGEVYANMAEITVPQQNEYIQLYVDNLESWKLANPIKKRKQ